MTHADIAAENKDRPLEEYGIEELIFTRADYSRIYSDYYYLITGHTPTFRIDVEYDGKIYQKNRHIALDCGCIYRSPLGMYCFDTGECIYSSENGRKE